MINGHGSDIHNYENAIITDFSSNVYYKGLAKGLQAHLVKKMPGLVNYPEPDASKLAESISNIHKVNNNMVLPCNGATEAFYLLAQLFKNSASCIVYPSFSEYHDACKIHNHKITYLHNQSVDFCAKFNTFKVIWLGNPNNPDGKLLKPEQLLQWIRSYPNIYFVIDEAYGDLCYGFESMVPYLHELMNVIVVKSLTKAYAISGLRLGYVLANSATIDLLKLIKIPWSVNSLAIEAGLYIMDEQKCFKPDVDLMYHESLQFQKQVDAIDGVEVRYSSTNYFLAKLVNGNAAQLKYYLTKKHGLLIRDASNFKGLTKQHFRLALQSPEQNKVLVKALKSWLRHE